MEKILKAISNEVRIKILKGISEGEKSVGDIINRLGGMNQSAVSQHLAVLREAKLVEVRREKQTIFYSLSQGSEKEIKDLLTSLSNLHLSMRGKKNERN